jgi:hypothetical protein
VLLLLFAYSLTCVAAAAEYAAAAALAHFSFAKSTERTQSSNKHEARSTKHEARSKSDSNANNAMQYRETGDQSKQSNRQTNRQSD